MRRPSTPSASARACSSRATDIPNVGRFAVLADPQGATFAAYTPGPTGGAAPAPGSGGFSWHELATTDVAGALRFYGELFGWSKGQGHDMGAMGVYQIFERFGSMVGGMCNVQGPATPPSWLSYVQVADSGRAVAAAKCGRRAAAARAGRGAGRQLDRAVHGSAGRGVRGAGAAAHRGREAGGAAAEAPRRAAPRPATASAPAAAAKKPRPRKSLRRKRLRKEAREKEGREEEGRPKAAKKKVARRKPAKKSARQAGRKSTRGATAEATGHAGSHRDVTGRRSWAGEKTGFCSTPRRAGQDARSSAHHWSLTSGRPKLSPLHREQQVLRRVGESLDDVILDGDAAGAVPGNRLAQELATAVLVVAHPRAQHLDPVLLGLVAGAQQRRGRVRPR